MDAKASVPMLKYFRSPQTVIGRFVARRTARTAAFWALVFGGYVAGKASGYASLYPTHAELAKFAATFGNNVGISALLGAPPHIISVAGLTAWNTLSVMVIIGSIWGFLTATRTLRGEEDAGRWELLISGHTTARRASVNVLAGLGASLIVMFAVTALVFTAIGKIHNIDFNTSAGLFFALTAIVGPAMFMAVGALAAELMPTRARAASFTATIFGISFLLRAIGDTANAHWLLSLSPLGWIENMQPLTGSHAVWFVPAAILIIVCSGLAVFLAGTRDLGDSTFADHDTAKPRTWLLNNPLTMAIRLNRTATMSWLVGTCAVAVTFGLLTKSAANAFAQSATFEAKLGKVDHGVQAAGARIFLGIVFLLVMLLVMAFVASSMGRVREDEAEGYVDNLLVRKIGRQQWLWGRVLLVVFSVVLATALATICAWASIANQGLGVSFHDLLLAGINAMAPAIFTLGVAVFALGFMPRLTTVLAYGVIAWSFLIDIVSSGLNLNHWITDTSVLLHMALSPAVSPNWTTAGTIAGLGVILCALGALAFNRRDLASE